MPIDYSKIKDADNARGPHVFIVNVPLRRNPESGELVRFLPLESAGHYGTVVELLPPGSPPASLDSYMEILRKGLEDFRDGDFLVAVGHQPLLIAAAAIVGPKLRTGRLRVLQWERRQEGYAPVVLKIGAQYA